MAYHTFMTIAEHIEDFRKRLIYILVGMVVGIVICLTIGSELIFYVRQLYTQIMVSEGLEPRLQSLAPSDGFITYIKVSILAGVILASPWSFYHLWQFIATGLYPREKRFIRIAVPMSAFLFISGVFFFIMIVAPLTLRFFIVFNKVLLGIDSVFTFEKYIFFIINMTLIFGFAFQTPTCILFLSKTGVVPLETFSKLRKYILLIVFILAAIITPPDLVSQVALAVPLYLLFEVGILISHFG